MERDPKRVLEYMEQIESAADDILTDRRHVIDLDRKRQETRVAARALHGAVGGTQGCVGHKQWVCFGDMFVKLPTPFTRELLDRDQRNLNEEITRIRDDIKVKVDRLRDLEDKPALKGFKLNALSRKEKAALSTVLPPM